MANDSRDWPRSRDTRINLFSGRSRSVGSFRSAHMEPGNSRLREPRLSIGAGIRDLERRTAEVPTILRNNINNVIEELRPIVERARTNTDTIMSVNNNGNVTLASWLGNPHPPAVMAPRDANNGVINSDEVVIDMDGGNTPVATVAQTNTTQANGAPSPTQSADTVNTSNSINSNNGSGDEQDIAETQVLNVSNSAVLNTICKYLPFVILILAKFFFDHIPGILMFSGLFFTFYYYNTMLKREVARQTPRSIPMFLFFVCHIMVAVGALFFVIYHENVLHLCLGIMPQTHQLTFSELLWSIVVTDYILKLITIVIKIIFTLLPQRLIPTSKRGKWYLFIEATSQLYRNCVPIQPWLHFLLESYSGPQKVIGVFLSAAYMVAKGNLLMNAFKLWWMSLLKVLRNVTIGVTPTKEQIASAGNLCSICHDEFKTPVLLECQHIFCEICVCKWLDREQTCPLCRAKIADDPSWRDGSTTHFIQLF